MPSGADSDPCLPHPSPAEILAVVGPETPMDGLRASLQVAGLGVDVVQTRGDALARFFASGGHEALLIGPDVAPGLAWSLASAIRDMSPGIPVLAFGATLARSPKRLSDATLLQDHHPDSRAAEAEVLRAFGMSPNHPDLLSG